MSTGFISRRCRLGLGDELLGAGLARGARAKGQRIAFGDGWRIIWHGHAHEVFRFNPNVAAPGQERSRDLKWIEHYPGRRLYCTMHPEKRRWIFNREFRATPGEVFLTDAERAESSHLGTYDVLIEPNVKNQAPNKQWPVEFYQEVADHLLAQGYKVAQVMTGPNRIKGAGLVKPFTFRHAVALLERSTLYIGPEGGLHHAMAAVRGKAVVIFGGFIHPRTTGYGSHVNLFHGDEPCGRVDPCDHCKLAMGQITPDQVVAAANSLLSPAATPQEAYA